MRGKKGWQSRKKETPNRCVLQKSMRDAERWAFPWIKNILVCLLASRCCWSLSHLLPRQFCFHLPSARYWSRRSPIHLVEVLLYHVSTWFDPEEVAGPTKWHNFVAELLATFLNRRIISPITKDEGWWDQVSRRGTKINQPTQQERNH